MRRKAEKTEKTEKPAACGLCKWETLSKRMGMGACLFWKQQREEVYFHSRETCKGFDELKPGKEWS